MRLTARKIEALKKKRGRYSDGHGLVLQVISDTNSSWLFCYERGGRAHAMGLGPTHTISLKEARESARAARQLLLGGTDPLQRKRAERDRRTLEAGKNVTFKECTEQYFARHESKWSNRKHRAQFQNTLATYVYPTMGSMPVAMIDESLVLKCLQKIWTTKYATAARVRQRIEAVLDYATASKLRSGDNPARWQGNLQHLLPSPTKQTEHHAAIRYAEIAAFMSRLRDVPGVAARALEFTILTASRSGEARGAKWDEIDLANRTWTIPSARMKGAREHRVPLAPRAMELLSDLGRERDNEYVFIGATRGSAIGSNAMSQVLKKLDSAATVHGFRSAFSDWAHESTGFPNHIIEASLAHIVGSSVERAYRRGDLISKRRKLMEAWAQ